MSMEKMIEDSIENLFALIESGKVPDLEVRGVMIDLVGLCRTEIKRRKDAERMLELEDQVIRVIRIEVWKEAAKRFREREDLHDAEDQRNTYGYESDLTDHGMSIAYMEAADYAEDKALKLEEGKETNP